MQTRLLWPLLHTVWVANMALLYSDILNNAAKIVGGSQGSATSKNTKQTYENIKANVGKYVASPQSVKRPSAYEQTVINDFATRLGDYDWQSGYTYDVWSEEDAKRKKKGEMPLYQYNRYDLDDPVDKYLYDNGLPPKKDLEGLVQKAEKETEKEAEEAEQNQYAEWREKAEKAKHPSIFDGVDISAAIDKLKKDAQANQGTVSAQDAVFGDAPYEPAVEEKTPFEKLVGGVKAAIDKGATLQSETTPKATAQPAEDVPMYNGVPLYDAVFDDGRPAKPAAQDWRQQIVGAFDKVANLSAAEVAAMHEERAQAKSLAEETDTSEYDAYIRGELDELSPEGLAAHDAKEQIEAYKKSPVHGKDYSFVTDDEWATYASIYKKRGVGAANGYLSSIYERAAQRSAEDELQRFKGGIVDKVIQTLSAGFDNAIKGAQRLTSKDFIAQTDAPTVQAYQQARSEEEGVAALVSDALFAIGNMTPSMITGGIAGTTAGAVAMGASAAGNAYDAEIKNGKTHEQPRSCCQ